ncbi:MAG TPA: LytR C-terminal domain-containing protein [Actinomycetota bacterium]|nr:LytR C-terminal domain-containing protein [Actinomycetota bacterium]
MKPGPTARAALVLVAFLAVFTVVDRMSVTGGGGTRTAAAPPAAQEPDTSAAATTTTAAPTTTTKAPTTTGAAPTTTKGTTGTTLRPASGVSVQVLNGVWVAGLAHRVAGQVRAAGYDVVAAKTALGSYSVSRIYYTGGHQADAEAFRDRFPAFSVIEPAPANLSRGVALHVVIGKDYPGV